LITRVPSQKIQCLPGSSPRFPTKAFAIYQNLDQLSASVHNLNYLRIRMVQGGKK